MTQRGKNSSALVAVLVTSLTAGCNADISKIAVGEVTAWKCDKEPSSKKEYVFKPYEYIIQAPADTIGIGGAENYRSSTILNTKDPLQKLPAGWVLSDSYSYDATDEGGFAISGTADGGQSGRLKQSLVLNGSTGKMNIKNGAETTTLQCKRIGDWRKVMSSIKQGPGNAYLDKRLSSIPLLRKKAGDVEFSSEIAKEANINNDHASVYGLLSPLPSSSLTTQDSDLVEAAKKRLIENDASSYAVWEWNNSWQGSYYTDDEKSSRCSNLAGNPYQEGYKIVSSTPQERIGGTGLTCHGTLHLLKKEGTLQAAKPADLLPAFYD
jgi:hypothetical protein